MTSSTLPLAGCLALSDESLASCDACDRLCVMPWLVGADRRLTAHRPVGIQNEHCRHAEYPEQELVLTRGHEESRGQAERDGDRRKKALAPGQSSLSAEETHMGAIGRRGRFVGVESSDDREARGTIFRRAECRIVTGAEESSTALA